MSAPGISWFDQSTYGGCAKGMPRNWLVRPKTTPVTVALSRVTVGAARACPVRANIPRIAQSTLVCNCILGKTPIEQNGWYCVTFSVAPRTVSYTY